MRAVIAVGAVLGILGAGLLLFIREFGKLADDLYPWDEYEEGDDEE